MVMILNLILIAVVYCKNCIIDFNYKQVDDNGYTAYAIRKGDIICSAGVVYNVRRVHLDKPTLFPIENACVKRPPFFDVFSTKNSLFMKALLTFVED